MKMYYFYECDLIESPLAETVDQSQQEGEEVMEVYSDEVIIRPRELSETLMEQLENRQRESRQDDCPKSFRRIGPQTNMVLYYLNLFFEMN
ncbi:MAG: hypothetical protein ACI30I_06595 [Parabacteroides sp.]